jgi:demethylmenaquinone methyltransferase / 2-methoxy-6-polyprenyl-1,4-benzoquinol methylase
MSQSSKNAGAPPGKPLPPHSVLADFYGSPAERARFVSGLFDRTARYYDKISGTLSFGTDRRYRREALQRAGVKPGLKLLDVASGTGLVARAALDVGIAPDDLIGLDPSRGMLEENQRQTPIGLIQGLGETLPFADETFDFVTMGYALRHVADLLQLFQEFRRVLKPGGRVLILEISRPSSSLKLRCLRFYMQKVIPRLVRWGTGDRASGQLMEYYWATIEQCVPPESILEALHKGGFATVERKVSWGMLSDYSAVKPASAI